jgi:hypothetical protein
VSINAKGDIVAIGALYDDNSGNNSGSTKIYQKGLRGNVTIEDDLSVGGDLIVNGGIYTDNFSVADTTGHTTIGGDIICNGKIDCNEINVNSLPLNSFTNYSYNGDYDPSNNWGKGEVLKGLEHDEQISYSHSEQFTLNTSDYTITCNNNFYGTYEITAHVVFRSKTDNSVLNPCIGIAKYNDTTTGSSPNFELRAYSQSPFSYQHVRMTKGRVTSLNAKRIHHFTDSTEKVSIRYIYTKGWRHRF